MKTFEEICGLKELIKKMYAYAISSYKLGSLCIEAVYRG